MKISASTVDPSDLHTHPFKQAKKLKEFLKTPDTPRRKRGPPPKGHVLTSWDNLILLQTRAGEEKERGSTVKGGTQESQGGETEEETGEETRYATIRCYS